MPAGTAIAPIDRPRGQIQQYSFTLTPGSIAASGTEVETVAIPNVNVNDAIIVTPPTAGFAAGLILSPGRVSALGTVTFNIFNITAGALTPAAGTFVLTIIRGSTMAFAR